MGRISAALEKVRDYNPGPGAIASTGIGGFVFAALGGTLWAALGNKAEALKIAGISLLAAGGLGIATSVGLLFKKLVKDDG